LYANNICFFPGIFGRGIGADNYSYHLLRIYTRI
jgi:hypothetical protein